MTFIDWSDPDEMLTLLVEYVSDELTQAAHDRGRNCSRRDAALVLFDRDASAPGRSRAAPA
jgi:hypothetical protein